MGQDNSLQRNLKFFDTVKLGFEEPLNKEQLGNSERDQYASSLNK